MFEFDLGDAGALAKTPVPIRRAIRPKVAQFTEEVLRKILTELGGSAGPASLSWVRAKKGDRDYALIDPQSPVFAQREATTRKGDVVIRSGEWSALSTPDEDRVHYPLKTEGVGLQFRDSPFCLVVAYVPLNTTSLRLHIWIGTGDERLFWSGYPPAGSDFYTKNYVDELEAKRVELEALLANAASLGLRTSPRTPKELEGVLRSLRRGNNKGKDIGVRVFSRDFDPSAGIPPPARVEEVNVQVALPLIQFRG